MISKRSVRIGTLSMHRAAAAVARVDPREGGCCCNFNLQRCSLSKCREPDNGPEREREGESCRGRNGNTLLILTYGIFIMRHTQWCPTSRECHEAFVSRVAFREFFMLTREAEAGHKDIIIIINKA